MTPDKLEAIRDEAEEGQRYGDTFPARDVLALLDYIDLLHEDLRITRQERDHAKHQALEHRKARARLEYDLLTRDEKDTE